MGSRRAECSRWRCASWFSANGNAGRAHLVLSQPALTPQERDLHLAEAFRLLNRATEIHPGFVDAWFNLATLYEWLGRTDEMEAAWNAARRLFPQHPHFATFDPQFAASFASQGEEALAGGDPAAARAHFERALRYQPELAAAWGNCTRAFAQEARQDRVFEESLFWVVTRSLECFY